MQSTPAPKNKTFVRYANRKLYDSDTRSYVTTDQLLDMVQRGVCFNVINSGNKEAYTAQVLCQMLWKLSRLQVPIDIEQVLSVLKSCLDKQGGLPAHITKPKSVSSKQSPPEEDLSL